MSGGEEQKSVVVISVLGFIGNVILLSFLCRQRVGTRQTSILLRLQTVLDAFICLISMGIILQTPFWSVGVFWVDQLVCSLWHSLFLYWYLVHVSIYVLLHSVADRFICVVFPFYVKKRKLWHLFFSLTLVFLTGVPHLMIMFLEANIKPGDLVCSSTFAFYETNYWWAIPLRKISAITWYLFDYTLPTISIVISYAIIIRVLRRNRKNLNVKSNNSCSISSRRGLSMRLTLAMMVIASVLCCSLVYDSTFYVLITFNLVNADYFASNHHSIGIVLSALNSSVNPYVFLIIMPPLRLYVWRYLCKCQCFVCCRSAPENESTTPAKIYTVDTETRLQVLQLNADITRF